MIVLREGWAVQTGPPRKILEQPANVDVARLLGIFNLLPVEIRAHEQAWSGGGREGCREREFRVITASETLVAPCPGEVEHEFTEGVGLDERRRRGGEAAGIAQREVARFPSRTGANAARALEGGEELVASEGIVGCAERIPLRRGKLQDAVVVLGPVHFGFRHSSAAARSRASRDSDPHRAPPCNRRPPR